VIPAWAGKWIGRPYADKGRGPAYDCWGLVRAVLQAEAGLVLPDYAAAYTRADDRLSVAAAVEAGLADGWERVEAQRALDLLILRVAGRPWHCGVIVAPGLFLHAMPPWRDGRQLLSCIERLDSPHWARRIEGIYRRKVAN
jgi:cell wall-associated NlpC family hydrolase